METNESGLSSYYHHHQPQPQPPPPPPPQHSLTATTTATTTASPTNGILPNTPQMAYPHSVPSAAVSSPLETARRKRGRPRKYGTPEQAAAAKRLSSAASQASNSMKKEHVGGGGGGASSSASTKKSQLAALGSAGQSFTPHIIAVAAGEDVGQKIMWFMQQSKSEICILSASGSISNVSLRQPATSGGSITYEGRFDIISLSGSYVRTELGGRSGGLSACLATTDGQIIGGGVGGPLTAAGPIQVIVGTFIVDTKKDIVADVKADTYKMTPAVSSVPVSSSGFRAIDSSGSQFTIQPPRGMQMTPLPLNDWSGADTSNTGFDFSGRMGGGAHQSPENGEYEHIADRD